MTNGSQTQARLIFSVLLVFVAIGCSASDHVSRPTRIVLDPSTFPKISRPLLQETADQVAKTVDELIPGDYPHRSSSTIFCFVANGEWGNMPRAAIGKPWKVEPASASKYEMRVALTPSVLPGAWQRLAFQLAHELTHHKMDASVDNNAMESFATAVSLEVLHRLDYDPYREANERYYTQWVPPQVMAALSRREWDKVALYLRYNWRHEDIGNWDRGTHFVAAMAIRKIGGFPWERLLDMGATAECSSKWVSGRARYCPLSPSSLAGLSEPIQLLLSSDPVNMVIVRMGPEDSEGSGLTFKEKGKWVSLRWCRKTDPMIPDGFAPLN